MTDWLILIASGFLVGLLNAVAGGGSFFTLPALMLVGVPPMMANATGTAVLLPGYVASAWDSAATFVGRTPWVAQGLLR